LTPFKKCRQSLRCLDAPQKDTAILASSQANYHTISIWMPQ
jgi:hypothetical protein